jgi:hypothetical protein
LRRITGQPSSEGVLASLQEVILLRALERQAAGQPVAVASEELAKLRAQNRELHARLRAVADARHCFYFEGTVYFRQRTTGKSCAACILIVGGTKRSKGGLPKRSKSSTRCQSTRSDFGKLPVHRRDETATLLAYSHQAQTFSLKTLGGRWA